MKTLNVKRTSLTELRLRWGDAANILVIRPYWIRCNAKGAVKWNTAPIYTMRELREIAQRRPVNIISDILKGGINSLEKVYGR